ADTDFSGFFKIMSGCTGTTMQTDVAAYGVSYRLEEFQIQLLGNRIFTVQVAYCSCKGIDTRLLDKSLGGFRSREGLLDFLIVELLFVQVGTSAEIMRLAFHQRAGKLGILHHLF